MIEDLKDKNIIFVLTYSEAEHWANYYTKKVATECFPASDTQVIILDNGDQQIIKAKIT